MANEFRVGVIAHPETLPDDPYFKAFVDIGQLLGNLGIPMYTNCTTGGGLALALGARKSEPMPGNCTAYTYGEYEGDGLFTRIHPVEYAFPGRPVAIEIAYGLWLGALLECKAWIMDDTLNPQGLSLLSSIIALTEEAGQSEDATVKTVNPRVSLLRLPQTSSGLCVFADLYGRLRQHQPEPEPLRVLSTPETAVAWALYGTPPWEVNSETFTVPAAR